MKKTARFLVEKGFTLVELLIVIALIGVLAVAVLAAINPLEQLNRARDTGMESDASQLLAAIDRYYASQEEFPWQTVDSTAYPDAETVLLMTSADDPNIGICGTGGPTACTTPTAGPLLAQFELKSEFANRRFINTVDTSRLYIGKSTGSSSSVYACWIPTSQAKRAQADKSTSVIPDNSGTACAATDWTDVDTACFICIPR